MDFSVINALAHTVTAVGASWSRSQEWLLCTRVLWDRLYRPRSNATAQRDDGVVRSERTEMYNFGLHGHLEQLVRVGGYIRFHMA
jgi:hypothetical protein